MLEAPSVVVVVVAVAAVAVVIGDFCVGALSDSKTETTLQLVVAVLLSFVCKASTDFNTTMMISS